MLLEDSKYSTTSRSSSFEILSGYSETISFLDSIRAAGDANRNSFGFFAVSVYAEFIRNNCVYVLVNRIGEKSIYCGHLIFTQRYPIALVIQMFTSPDYRRSGLATKLINYFKNELTKSGFSSIYASVAEDLKEANTFWERQHFYIQTVKDGGKTRNRKILRRCHELQSHQLFPPSGIDNHNPLGLSSPLSVRDSLFLLDLNVLFDLSGPRRKRHKDAVSLFQAERLNICKLAISNEIREELHRNAEPGRLDPMEGVIDILPSFPLKKFDSTDPLFQTLLEIVFPEKTNLTPNDKSDLSHLATAVQHNLTGLITNDEKVLEAAPKIKTKLKIEVLSPTVFLSNDFPTLDSTFEGLHNTELSFTAINDSHFSHVHSFLHNLGINPVAISTTWLPTGTNSRIAPRYSVWLNANLIGYLTWSIRAMDGIIVARIALDESSTASNDAARIMVTFLIEKVSQLSPRQINLEFPAQQPTVRDIGVSLGFTGVENESWLNKLVLGMVLTETSWTTYQSQLLKNSKIKLPEIIPKYEHFEQQIPIVTSDGNRRYISLYDLETLLSPTLFCLPGRPAVITPIQRSYAEPLLGHSPQESFLPSQRASLFQDRHYISAPRTLIHFKRGTLILFYESGGNGGHSAIVAIARVRKSYLKASDQLDPDDLGHSVLTTEHVSSIGKNKSKTVTVFDNIFVLPRPVSLAVLRRLGCGADNQLISTNPISDKQLKELLHEAYR